MACRELKCGAAWLGLMGDGVEAVEAGSAGVAPEGTKAEHPGEFEEYLFLLGWAYCLISFAIGAFWHE